MDNDSHTFRVGPKSGVEEVICDFYVCHIRLKSLESESTWDEIGGESEVELAVCETVI